MFEYKMIQVPKDLSAGIGAVQQGAAQQYMQKLIDDAAAQGWEFYRIDSLTVTEKPGCLQALMGQKETFHSLNIVCFRREKTTNAANPIAD